MKTRGLHVADVETEEEDAQARIATAEASAADWLESWTRVVDDIGDLVHKARHRPIGKRHASIAELQQLLRGQS